ncbi:hypothetical protein AX14_001656 [Amanita brunnescens Koide BX004]|nr:hypothetical protein AX14_001656 [Amanita brunnescens Koide BX004]
MARAPKAKATQKKAGTSTRKSAKDLDNAASLSAVALRKASAQNRQDFCKSDRTRKSYDSCVVEGKAFLANLITKRRADATTALDGMDTNLLEKAFENPPNIHSVDALELFLSQKCFAGGLGLSTAQRIQGAFADYWDNMDGKKYAGPYTYNQSMQTWSGCPARADIIYETIKSIKNRHTAAGAKRRHAEAIMIEDLMQVMQWSEDQSPKVRLTIIPALTFQDHLLALSHGLMRAFMSTGFTLWTRNFELCNIQAGHIDRCLSVRCPENLEYFTVELVNRKGWMAAKGGPDGPLKGNTYNIYRQDNPAIDMFTHLRLWLDYLEYAIGRTLQSGDYIFPYIASNGQVHVNRAISHDHVQAMITEFTTQAGLEKRYTTHCFRRGGAQYRFLFAEPRWPLRIIRSWGGWASGEHVDTLMKYLFNSLQDIESDHRDALCPVQRELDKSFMGEQKQLQLITNKDFQVFSRSFFTCMNSLKASLIPLTCLPFPGQPAAFPTAGTMVPYVGQHAKAIANPSVTADSHGPFAFDVQQQAALGRAPSTSLIKKTRIASGSRPAPIPGSTIEDLPRGANAWRAAIKQWDEHLKDWEESKYKGDMRLVNGMKYKLRETIAVEFIEGYDRDEAKFLTDYPEANTGADALIKAIRKCHGRQRRSRNGTPEEREQQANSLNQQ